jgi:hypothetical protein
MAAWEFQALQNVAEKNGWHKFVSMQNYYNLIYREEGVCIPTDSLSRVKKTDLFAFRTGDDPVLPGRRCGSHSMVSNCSRSTRPTIQ